VVVEQRLRGSMLRSKLNFVDLAGSERWSERVEMSEVRVNEMTSINQSLSTLITVVASLTEEGRSQCVQLICTSYAVPLHTFVHLCSTLCLHI